MVELTNILNNMNEKTRPMEHCDFSYNDIIAAKKIRGQVKKAMNDSLKQTKLTNYLRK